MRTLRGLMKTAIAAGVAALPHGGRKAVVEGLSRAGGRYEAFQALGRAYNVRDVRVAGEYGLIEGSLGDGAVLRTYAATGTWAPHTVELISGCFLAAPGHRGTFIDIGANIGLVTIPVARNPQVRCIAFEPEPRNFAYLASNVAANCPHRNVSLHNLALFDRRAKLPFELSEENCGDHRLRLNGDGGVFGEQHRQTIEVQAERLDRCIDLDLLPRPIVVKVDTQGAEAHVVAGGQETLAAADLLIMEFWPYGLARMGGDVDAIIDFITASFRAGTLVNGESNETSAWFPIEAIGTAMAELRRGYENSVDYVDIIVRK
jgi:FkbM family methyltransferase